MPTPTRPSHRAFAPQLPVSRLALATCLALLAHSAHAQRIELLAGSTSGYAKSQSASAQMFFPNGIERSPNGNLFMTKWAGQRIQKNVQLPTVPQKLGVEHQGSQAQAHWLASDLAVAEDVQSHRVTAQPSGLSCTAPIPTSTCTIIDLPQSPAQTFSVTAINRAGVASPQQIESPWITTPRTLPTAVVGKPYHLVLEVDRGIAPYYFTMTAGHELPNDMGLTFGANPDRDVYGVSGVPTRTGSFDFQVTATDANNMESIPATFSVQVNPAVQITTTSLPVATEGAPYTATLQATGGIAPHTWALAAGSTLPEGMGLNPSTGEISGSPTQSGPFSLQFTAFDEQLNQASVTLDLQVIAALKITTTSLPTATEGAPYTTTLQATGGTTPYTWALAAGSTLPSGLLLDASTGEISGTPLPMTQQAQALHKTATAFDFSVVATDASDPQLRQTAQLSLSVHADAAAAPITATPVPALDGAALSLLGLLSAAMGWRQRQKTTQRQH